MTDSLATRWEAFTEAGRRCFGDKQLDKAEEAFLAALRTAEQFGESDPRLAQSLNNLARVYGRREKFFPAAALLHRLLGIQERAIGAEHPGLAGVINNLAEMYARLGDAQQELELRERALAIRVAAGEAAASVVGPLEQRIDQLRRKVAEEQAAATRSPSPATSVRVPSPASPAPLAPPLPAALSSIPAPLAPPLPPSLSSVPASSAASVWPEPGARPIARPAPSPAISSRPVAAETPPQVLAPALREASPMVLLAVEPPAPVVPLAPPLAPAMESSPGNDAAPESGDSDVYELPWRRVWRQRKQLIVGVAAAALIAASVLVGQGMSGSGPSRAEAAAGAPQVETATGGVTPAEMGQVDRSLEAPSAPPAAALDTEEIIAAYPKKKSRVPVSDVEVRRAAERGPTVAEVVDREAQRAARARGPVRLDKITEAIDRSARERVDSLERAAQTPRFERSREIPD